jgi:menaquinone-dependent protoporphyrinogen IX oxidase
MLNIKKLPGGFALGDYKAVIVGAPIHMGEHEEYVRDFIDHYIRPIITFSSQLLET